MYVITTQIDFFLLKDIKNQRNILGIFLHKIAQKMKSKRFQKNPKKCADK